MAAITEEQTLIRDQARAWVTEQSPVSKFRKMRDEDAPLSFLEEDWRAMIDMGWSGILVPERYGGSGLGYLTLGIVLEETGRQLTASPLLASAGIGATALLVAGSEEQRQRILPGIVDGRVISHIPKYIFLRLKNKLKLGVRILLYETIIIF